MSGCMSAAHDDEEEEDPFLLALSNCLPADVQEEMRKRLCIGGGLISGL